MPNNYTQINAGTLIHVRDVGVYLRAAFNEDDGGRPFVSIDTSELPARWCYDERTKLRADTDTPPFSCYEDGACTVVKRGDEVVSRHYPYERSTQETRRAAEQECNRLNKAWRESCGMPVIEVHLNDGAAVYSDEGAGNTAHLAEQVVERLRRMTAEAEAKRDEDDARGQLVTQDTEEAEQSGAIAGRAEALREVLEMLQNGESE